MSSPSLRALVPAACLLVAAAAGCIGGDSGAAADDASPSRSAPGSGGASPSATGGTGAHVHDYWNGATQLVLYDGSIPVTVLHNHAFDEPPRPQHTHSCDESVDSTSQGGSVKFALPPGDIVLPGTEDLEIQASWDVPTITALRLLYRSPTHEHPEEPGGHDHQGDFSDAGPLPNGGSVSIPLSTEMADLGHETRSRWAFFLCADTDDPNLAEGSVGLTITAHRARELPLDPPHPDHWGGDMSILLAGASWSGESLAIGNQGEADWLQLPLAHGSIVPADTDHVLVLAWLNGTGLTEAALASALTLYYKDSTVPDWVYTRVDGTVDGNLIRFAVPIEESAMTDSPYAAKSNWDFWLRVSSDVDASLPAGLGTWSAPHQFEGSIEARVLVFRGSA